MNLIPKHRTAVLIFARSSQEELKHKKINRGKFLFDTLNRHTLKTVEDTGIPFYHLTEKTQQGVSFGERFSNAIQQVFDQGYHRIIAVGNDCPHLTKEHILNATMALDNSKLVLGPAADGGFYLMGLHYKDFKKADLVTLSWQTSKISQQVLNLFAGDNNERFLLPQLVDIDTFQDVIIIAEQKFGLNRTIRDLVLSIASKNLKTVFPKLFSTHVYCAQTPFNKGSPFSSFS